MFAQDGRVQPGVHGFYWVSDGSAALIGGGYGEGQGLVILFGPFMSCRRSRGEEGIGSPFLLS